MVDPRYKLFVFEALKVKNMIKKAKPKQDAKGHWLRSMGQQPSPGSTKPFWRPPGARPKYFCSTRLVVKASW